MSGKEIKGTTAEETIRCILEEEKMTQQDLAGVSQSLCKPPN